MSYLEKSAYIMLGFSISGLYYETVFYIKLRRIMETYFPKKQLYLKPICPLGIVQKQVQLLL